MSRTVALAVAASLALIASQASAANVPADVGSVTISQDFVAGSVNLQGLKSMRSNSPAQGVEAIALADTYNAAILGQSTAGAGFITNAGRTTTFTYDLLSSLHGTLVGSNAAVNIGETQTVTGVNSLRVVVGALTADSSDLWLSGITLGGVAMTQGRYDVGSAAIGGNGLLWDNIPGPISSVTITNAVFADGVALATSTPLTNLQTLPNMGSAVVWNGVVGSGVDETQMIFDITYTVPEPASMTALGGAFALFARRRRA